jgi:thiol-disulfide isomerase/thioredoxin
VEPQSAAQASSDSAASPPAASLRGLPGRVGQLLLAPRAALLRIDREGGALTDALWLVALGIVTFRFAALLEALLGFSDPAGAALSRLALVAAGEIRDAAWVVLPAAVIVTALAGARRDSTKDLELGAACFVPYFAVHGVARALDIVLGGASLGPVASEGPAAVVALVVLIQAVRVARARAGSFPAPVIVQPRRPALLAGLGVIAVAAVGLAGNARFATKNFSALLPVRSGQAAPGFNLARADGTPGAISLDALHGKVVVLDFWATWCPPCLAMLPALHELDAEWKDRGVSFVGINSDGDIAPEALQGFLRQHGVPYPVVIDDGEVGARYKVRSLPQMVVIGKDGSVRKTFVGFTTKASLERALADAVAAP